jgi:hypothetical protein
MPKYTVSITGTACINVDADSSIHAQEVAQKNIRENRFGIWDMHMNFSCDECDEIAPEIDSPEWSVYRSKQIARFKEQWCWDPEPDLNCDQCNEETNYTCDECVAYQLNDLVNEELEERDE